VDVDVDVVLVLVDVLVLVILRDRSGAFAAPRSEAALRKGLSRPGV
jgi:hypothetical protein